MPPKLRDRLEQTFPGQVFLDVSGIDAGDDFVDRLKAAVSSSKALLAVIGPGWISSRDSRDTLGQGGDFVTEEIATAIEAGIPIVPVLIEGAQMPYPSAVRATFTNRCKGPVTFVVSRSTAPTFIGFYSPWFEAPGHEFAVIMLRPEQAVHVPLGGTYGSAFQPWICRKEMLK